MLVRLEGDVAAGHSAGQVRKGIQIAITGMIRLKMGTAAGKCVSQPRRGI